MILHGKSLFICPLVYVNYLILLNLCLYTNHHSTLEIKQSNNLDIGFDIIQLFDNSRFIQNKLLQLSLIKNYPKTARFYFESYDSFHEKQRLIKSIKTQRMKV